MSGTLVTRRSALVGSAAALAAGAVAAGQAEVSAHGRSSADDVRSGWAAGQARPFVRARDGTPIFVKDWGDPGAPPVILIHGYPLNADSFDKTALRLANAGFRVINYDRRGFGRSGQPWTGYDWNTYADDLADVMQTTGATRNVTVIGYSMGGGECARYMSRHGGRGIAKLGLYASIVPGLLRSASNPAGHTETDYRGIVSGIENDAAAYFRHEFLPPFYGKNGAARYQASDDVLEWAVGAAMMGGIQAQP